MPNEDEAWHDATSQAAGGKQQKSYHKNLENFGRIISRSGISVTVFLCIDFK